MSMLFSIINGNTSNRFRNEYFLISLNPILLLRMPNRFVGEATSLRAKEGKSTHRRYFIIKDVFKKFAIFTRKHLYRSLFCVGCGLQHRCFPANIAKSLRTLILKNICQRQLLQGAHECS